MISETESVRPSLRRGWRQRCPACGEGTIFSSYLKVRDTCPVCGQELFHHRADDGPAYLSILIVGHVATVLVAALWEVFRPEPIVLASAGSVFAILLALWLLPRLKGTIIAYQWARGMYGFGPAAAKTAAERTGAEPGDGL